MTDQELADAIRARFGKGGQLRDLEKFGFDQMAEIVAFCDQHPAWQPTPGALAFDQYKLPVVIVGPHPKLPDMWVVCEDDLGDDLAVAYASELTPRDAS